MTAQDRQPAVLRPGQYRRRAAEGRDRADEAVAFVARCREVHGLDIVGLMGIPPVDARPGPISRLLAAARRDGGLANLSMGMSADFEIAIAMGATHVRVGSALFGVRPAAIQH